MERLDCCVSGSMHRQDCATRAAFSLFVIEGGVVNQFVIAKCLSPYRFNVAMFGFRKGYYVCVGVRCKYVL